MNNEPFIIEISLTHDHSGLGTPAHFTAYLVPLVGENKREDTDNARSLTLPLAFDTLDHTDQGFNEFLAMAADGFEGEPFRVDFSLEGEDDCMVCVGQREVELISQGRMH